MNDGARDQLILGDSAEVLKTLPDSSVDAIVCDPPAGVSFMGARWDTNKGGRDQWIAWLTGIMAEALRVLKPGGHALVWALPRTSHWTGMALEDAGFTVKDCLTHLFGCLSEDTEVLTAGGWRGYRQCHEGTPVLGFCNDSDSYEWMPVREVFVYDYCDTAYHIFSDHTDQLVSRNHRCLVKRGRGYAFIQAEELERCEIVPVLEDLPGLLRSLPLHGRGGGSWSGDMLATLQGAIRQAQTKCRPGAAKASRKCKVRLPLYEELRAMRKTVRVHEPYAGPSQQDMRAILRGDGDKNCQSKGDGAAASCLEGGDMSAMRQGVRSEERHQGGGLLQPLVQWARACLGPKGAQRQHEGQKEQGAPLWSSKPLMEGRRHLLQEARQLYRRQVCALPRIISWDGPQGRLCYGASAVGGASNGPAAPAKRGSPSQRPQSTQQQSYQSSAFRIQQRSQAVRGAGRTSPDMVTVEPTHYEGKVWCVRVASGAFVARRNGKVFVTGNSGFPKSADISKHIDRMAGAEREVVGKGINFDAKVKHGGTWTGGVYAQDSYTGAQGPFLTAPATDEAKQWEGWGTATKPAAEFWFLCRKPLAESTIAGNVLAWGTGGLNIDACRIATTDHWEASGVQSSPSVSLRGGADATQNRAVSTTHAAGRWPANLLLSHHESCVRVGTSTVRANGSVSGNEPSAPALHVYGEAERKPFVAHGNGDGTEGVEQWVCAEECPVRLLDEQSGHGGATKQRVNEGDEFFGGVHEGYKRPNKSNYTHKIAGQVRQYESDGTSGASRFFTTFAPAEDAVPFRYVPKPSRRERNLGCEDLAQDYEHSGPRGHHLNGDGTPPAASLPRGNTHSTVKSVELMRWLCSLICRPGGTILDPFMGSGSTGVACAVEGFGFIGIEQEAEYMAIAERRIAYARAHPDAFTGKMKPAKVAPAQQPAPAPAPSPLPTTRRRRGPRMEMVSLFGNEEGAG